MIYSMLYNIESKYKDEVEEYRINYAETTEPVTLCKFIQEHNDKRIFITVANTEDFLKKDSLKKIAKILRNIKCDITFCYMGDMSVRKIKEVAAAVKEYNFSYCFNIPISSIDMLYGICELGVSDIYVTNELGFMLPTAHSVAEAHNIKVRCFPDMCQTDWPGFHPLFCFWIRPEDINTYSEYIDVLEFFKDTSEKSLFDVMYKIYKYEKSWHHELDYLITGMDKEIKSNCIIPSFGTHRINCGKKCFKGSGCHICHYIVEIADSLKKSKMYVKSIEGNEENDN